MAIRKRKTGVVVNRELFANASVWKEAGERVQIYGPFSIGEKRYDIAVYYPTKKFWWRLFRNGPYALTSPVISTAYFGQKNLDELVHGVRVYDRRGDAIRFDRDIYLKAYRTVRIWLRVYFTPFYPPRSKTYVKKLELVKRLADRVRKQGFPTARTDVEKMYVGQLRVANEQLYANVGILERHNKVVLTMIENFKHISDKPSTVQIEQLRISAERFKGVLTEMADWCEDRARTWEDFVDAVSAYRVTHAHHGFIRSLLLRTIWYGVTLGVSIFSGGSVLWGGIFSVGSDMGFQYIWKLLLQPRGQAKTLEKTAIWYKDTIRRVDEFLTLYSVRPSDLTAFRSQS